jgi:hypothetical protein
VHHTELQIGRGAGATSDGALTVTLGELTDGGEPGEKRAIVVKFNGGKTLLELQIGRGAGATSDGFERSLDRDRFARERDDVVVAARTAPAP